MRRGIGLLIIAALAIAALSITPATAGKFLTKKKGDKRYVNEGQAAVTFGAVNAGALTAETVSGGAISAGSFEYTSPQQNVVVVPAAAFSNGSGSNLDHAFGTMGVTAANDEAGVAGVSLPHGAVVTQVDAIVDNPANGGSIQLVSNDPVADETVTMSGVSGTCSTGNLCTLVDQAISENPIDNVNRHYGILLYADTGESIRLHSVAIHYTTTAVGPATG
jgi:hypothetical protein